MKSFLITYKPATENPELGWPIEELRRLVRANKAGRKAIEPWRFNNRKEVSVGDRVFLLLQGKGGPAVIGYGEVAGAPQNDSGDWFVPVQFESIVDPTNHCLADRDEVRSIPGADRFWRIMSSGVRLPDSVGEQLESLVVGASPKLRGAEPSSNPDWERDELILALSFYLQTRPNPPGKNSAEIRDLSVAIRRIGNRLHPSLDPSETFRNENGVYMKLMNFRSLDPSYVSDGKTGLARGSSRDREVWDEFATDTNRCRLTAETIIASLDEPEIARGPIGEADDSDIQEAPEGRLLTRLHVARERNRRLVESKRRQAMKTKGKLACEACGFDFASCYGERGKGFIECHHTKPVATLVEGHTTHLDDLALVCANCHRMIHRYKQWLTVAEVRAMLSTSR